MRHLISSLAAAVSLVFASSAIGQEITLDPEPIIRPESDFTVYVLTGDTEILSSFHEEIGANWEGGTFLRSYENTGEYHYLAYAWRTAPQARMFMMPAMFAGLELEFRAYDDATYFPELRSIIDQELVKCGVKVDPMLILSSDTVSYFPQRVNDLQSMECMLDFVKSGGLGENVSFGFLGNEKIEEVEEN
ncbi:hypothetical protein ACRAQ6_12095 [Erythrobacter sp. HA6-11]